MGRVWDRFYGILFSLRFRAVREGWGRGSGKMGEGRGERGGGVVKEREVSVGFFGG